MLTISLTPLKAHLARFRALSSFASARDTVNDADLFLARSQVVIRRMVEGTCFDHSFISESRMGAWVQVLEVKSMKSVRAKFERAVVPTSGYAEEHYAGLHR